MASGFAALKPAEQMQAAALALFRELSVDPQQLRLAVLPCADDPNAARIAFCAPPVDGKTLLETTLLAAMQPNTAFWVDAPSGYIVGPRGAAVVDFAGSQDALPSVVEGTLAHISADPAARCVLVNRNASLASEERMAWWAAASGVVMVDGELPVSKAVPLVTPLRGRVTARKTRLDRALQWAAVGSVVCLGLSALPYAKLATPAATEAPRNSVNAGALLDRLGTIAPDVVAQAQSATFASGAWVLVLPDAFNAEALARSARALEANGILVQTTRAPGPRLRVQLP